MIPLPFHHRPNHDRCPFNCLSLCVYSLTLFLVVIPLPVHFRPDHDRFDPPTTGNYDELPRVIPHVTDSQLALEDGEAQKVP